MTSMLLHTNWTPNGLANRIQEGELLLRELPADSDWVPIVSGRLNQLRLWLADLELT